MQLATTQAAQRVAQWHAAKRALYAHINPPEPTMPPPPPTQVPPGPPPIGDPMPVPPPAVDPPAEPLPPQ